MDAKVVTGRKQFHLLDKDLDASDVKMSLLVVILESLFLFK
jgi:hypothetical protein